MIRVAPVEEPATFDSVVRQRGLRAINELTGAPSDRTKGRKFKKVAATKNEIPAIAFPPYWRDAIGDLLSSYQRVCAYLSLYIPRGTGAPSVDHMLPKSTAWDQVYEWHNYRLACSLMNSRKGALADALDPFEIEDDWFELELVDFQVVPCGDLSEKTASAVASTISRLRLSDQECCEARAEYAQEYWDGNVSLDYITRHAPFVARELHRQGALRPGDES